ncbi:MAG: response regulator transcription factor [Verrucomicrobiota bacterium]|jgi:DNA-binding NarL/FixJ family response regulator
MNIRVAVVEDNDTIRESLALILDGSPGFRCTGAWRTAEEALRGIPQRSADVVLMDINLPKQSGIECVRQLKALLPRIQIIMLTIEHDSQTVFESLMAGATGYLVKNVPPAQILAAIEEVHRGGSPMSSQIARMLVEKFQERSPQPDTAAQLTPREGEVLGLAAKGYRSKEIAEALSLSPQTVETHFRNICEKLHVRSRTEAVVRFLER